MRRARRHKPIGQMLIEKGLITPQQLREALEAQRQSDMRIGEILVNLGYLDRRALYETLSEQLGVPFVDLTEIDIDPAIARLIPRDMAEKYQCIPIGRGDGTIKVAMAEPGNVMAEDDLRLQLQVPVESVLADPEAISETIRALMAEAPGGGPAETGAAIGAGLAEVRELAESVRESGLLGVQEEAPDEYTKGQVVTDRVADLA
ncbi:MAG: hypothetical protein H5T86_13460, partial [Armatimonadetes bacterium]|nr:hypothetical protein [Armatimonadota bacterium]